MKVWVIGRGYPTVKNNMLGSFELEQAQMLSRAGLDVSYLVVDLRSIRRWRRFGFYCRKEDGVTVAYLNLPIGRLLPKKTREKIYFPAMKQLMAYLEKKTGKPDVIHVHYPSLVPYRVVEDLQKQGTKLVATEHWTKVQDKTLPPINLVNLKDFADKADAMCCVGSNLRNSIVELTGTKKTIHIVPNVVSNVFQPIAGPHEGFRFVCSGRLVPVKQFDLIVSSFIDVFQTNKNVSLTVAGGGEEYEKIKSIVTSRNAEDQVHLPGEVSRQEMASLIAESDTLVVFSKLETFCVPVIEAWACGKPVIATTTTVLADNPDRRLGIMTDCRDTDTLKNALKNLYENYSEYDSNWIKEYADSHFSEEAVSRELIKIYTNNQY